MHAIKDKFEEYLPKNRLSLLILGLVLGAVIGVIGEYLHLEKNLLPPTITRINAEGGNYKYVAPLLAYNVDDVNFSEQTAGLQSDINTVINNYKNAGQISDVSEYYRGPKSSWVGINDSEQYNPA